MTKKSRIVGLDVCRSSVMAVCLDEGKKPFDVREYYHNEAWFVSLPTGHEGLKGLLELEPDVIVLEPTGVNYSKFWIQNAIANEIAIAQVGHRQLASYRTTLGIEDKTDQLDALALACYFCDYGHLPNRFVGLRDRDSQRLREIALRLAHLARVQSPIINRLRQDLEWQFPEAANIRSSGLLWQWMAGDRESNRYENLYFATAGAGLTKEARYHAERLCSLIREEKELGSELNLLLLLPNFAPYRRVFEQFGFGDRVAAMILSQIYPFEKFLGDDKRPIVTIRPGKISGKPTKRHLSRRRFEKAIGCAPQEYSSGNKRSLKQTGGSALCRRALWQWHFCRIEVRRARPKNEIIEELASRYEADREAKMPTKLARGRSRARVARKLFYLLADCLH